MLAFKNILICILLFLLLQVGNAQSDLTGFYVVLDKKQDCVNPFKSLTVNTPLCLSKSPIVSKSDFESISQIYADSTHLTKYVNLKITKEAFSRFQLLGKKLPKTSLALVIDGTIVGVIENLQQIGNPIPIYSTLYSGDIDWVYEKLKNLKIQDKP